MLVGRFQISETGIIQDGATLRDNSLDAAPDQVPAALVICDPVFVIYNRLKRFLKTPGPVPVHESIVESMA